MLMCMNAHYRRSKNEKREMQLESYERKGENEEREWKGLRKDKET